MEATKSKSEVRDQGGRDLIVKASRQRMTADIACARGTSAIECDPAQFVPEYGWGNLAEVAETVAAEHFELGVHLIIDARIEGIIVERLHTGPGKVVQIGGRSCGIWRWEQTQNCDRGRRQFTRRDDPVHE